MAATKSKRVNTRSGLREFRMPVGYKKVLGLVRSTDTLSTLHSQLEASSDIFNRKSGSGVSALAMKLASHTLSGGVADLNSTRHIVGEIERDLRDTIAGVLDSYGVVGENRRGMNVGNTTSIAEDMIRENPNLPYSVELNINEGKLKKGVIRATSRAGGYGLTVTDMRNHSNSTTLKPMEMIESDANSELSAIVTGLANSKGIVKGNVGGLHGVYDYVAAPIYTHPEQVKTSMLSDEAKADIEMARADRMAEREVLFANDKYKGMTPDEIEEFKLAEAKAAELELAANAAVDSVFAFVNEKIYDHAKEKSQAQLQKYGTTSVDEDGVHHPYTVRKSANHNGAVLLDDAVRVPRAGNYFFEKGYADDGSHYPARAYDEALKEIKQFMAEKHPTVDFDVFAEKNLDANSMGYFRALTTTNPALASNENCATEMLFPIVNMNGDLRGVQRLTDDNYSHKNNKTKTNMRGTKLTTDDVFMPVGKPFSRDTEVVVIGEGRVTAESLAIAMFGKDFNSIPNLAVIAAVDSNNTKKITPKIDSLFEQQFDVKRNLRHVIGIDNDIKGIDPFGRHSSYRTRDSFERDETNEHGARLTHVPDNAGLGVYEKLSGIKSLNAAFITVPSKYNQEESTKNVRDKELTARHNVPDINDVIVLYGLDKAREILAPQIKTAALDINTTPDAENRHSVPIKLDKFDATATDFAIQAAFKELSPLQADKLLETRHDAQRLHLALKNKEFRNFISDYVAEVEQSNPMYYKPFANLRDSFVGADMATNMENSLSRNQRSEIVVMLAAAQLNSPEIDGNLKDLNVKIKELAEGPIGKKHPEQIGLMVHGVERFLEIKSGPDMLNKVFGDFRQTNFSSVDMLSSTYFGHAAKSFERSGLPGSEGFAKKSADIKDNVYDTLRRRIDPEIIAMQISPDADPVPAKLEPLVPATPQTAEAKNAEPIRPDDSPSMGM